MHTSMNRTSPTTVNGRSPVWLITCTVDTDEVLRHSVESGVEPSQEQEHWVEPL